jgi:hypothetical protein
MLLSGIVFGASSKGGTMQVVSRLEDIEPRCLALVPKEEEDFCVGEGVTEEAAREFIFEVNQKREGHVWVDIVEVAAAPEITTHLHVRCTN